MTRARRRGSCRQLAASHSDSARGDGDTGGSGFGACGTRSRTGGSGRGPATWRRGIRGWGRAAHVAVRIGGRFGLVILGFLLANVDAVGVEIDGEGVRIGEARLSSGKGRGVWARGGCRQSAGNASYRIGRFGGGLAVGFRQAGEVTARAVSCNVRGRGKSECAPAPCEGSRPLRSCPSKSPSLRGALRVA